MWRLRGRRVSHLVGGGLRYEWSKSFATVGAPVRSHIESEFPVGRRIAGFEVTENRAIPELSLTAVRLQHRPTSAEYLHIDGPSSSNAVFALGFRTPPPSSAGHPHILEHLVLCGSENYPVRDPFFVMHRRSVANFMNAMTASDFTIYPFSTENKDDYKALRAIYTDAVFRPRLRETDFRQEGWRLEDGEFKGVVYNEMKGAMADTSDLFRMKLQQYLFPSTIYEHNSGGEPKEIPSLTHQDLINFHKQYYTPQNTKAFAYGDANLLMDNVSYLESTLGSLKSGNPIGRVQDMPKEFDKPRYHRVSCPVDPMGDPERMVKHAIAFLGCPVSDAYETFALKIFVHLLQDGPSSPLFQELLETNIGSDYCPGAGFDGSTARTSIILGAQGVETGGEQKVESAIASALQKIREGVDQKRIDGVIHSLEMATKQRSARFGLGVLMSLSGPWLQTSDGLPHLEVSQHITRLRGEVEAGTFFRRIVDTYFFSNNHRVHLTMVPDKGFEEVYRMQEHDDVRKMSSSLTDEEKQKIDQQNEELKKFQGNPQDVSGLPMLQLESLADSGKVFPLVTKRNITRRITSTNGINYCRAFGDIKGLSQEERKCLPSFCGALTFLGTRDRTMAELEEDIRMYTNGVSFSSATITNPMDLNSCVETFGLSSASFTRNTAHMMNLISTLENESDLENIDRIKTFVVGVLQSQQSSVLGSGSLFAKSLAASGLGLDSLRWSEEKSGLSQMWWLEKIVREGSYQPVSELFKKLREKVSRDRRWLLTSTTEEDANELERFCPESSARLDFGHVMSRETRQQGKNRYVVFPTSVHYAATCRLAVPYLHADSVPLSILAELLSTHYLHAELREKQGAYGGGAMYSPMQGIFSFYTYRSPLSVEPILTTFRSIPLSDILTKDHLHEAKIKILGGMDSPVSACDEGAFEWKFGLSDEVMEGRRKKAFETGLEDVERVWETYVLGKEAVSAVIGSRDGAELAREQGWEIIGSDEKGSGDRETSDWR